MNKPINLIIILIKLIIHKTMINNYKVIIGLIVIITIIILINLNYSNKAINLLLIKRIIKE